MSAKFPNGTVFSMAKLTAAALAITAISNADPGVASCANPPIAGSIGVLTSAWPGINNRVVQVGTVVANTSFVLSGYDTTDVTQYPAGLGAGSSIIVVDPTVWVPFSQVASLAKSGGTQQYFQWQYVEDQTNLQQQRPTYKQAKVITLTFDYDPSLSWYAALVEADRLQQPVVLRAVLPGGDTLYYYVYPSFDGDPTMTLNQNMTNTATFSLISLVTRYDA